jgi:hypothetical protein
VRSKSKKQDLRDQNPQSITGYLAINNLLKNRLLQINKVSTSTRLTSQLKTTQRKVLRVGFTQNGQTTPSTLVEELGFSRNTTSRWRIRNIQCLEMFRKFIRARKTRLPRVTIDIKAQKSCSNSNSNIKTMSNTNTKTILAWKKCFTSMCVSSKNLRTKSLAHFSKSLNL